MHYSKLFSLFFLTLIVSCGGGGGGAVAHSAMSGSYWSSSEFDATRGLGAFIMNFGGLVFMHGNAEFANDNKIRPVRAF